MDRIEHSGVVKRVDAERVCVEITAHGACGSCKAREACGLGETGQKIVEIRTPAAATYRPGDRVTVAITRRTGAVAVLLAYVVPFVVLIGVVAVCYLLGAGDGAAVLAGLGSVVLYYGILWLLRQAGQCPPFPAPPQPKGREKTARRGPGWARPPAGCW